jgi:Fe-Mn family superoxide dismutase
MAYEARDYSKLLGMAGFSDNLLNNHFSLYQGYVKNTNKLMEQLNSMIKDLKADSPAPEYSELKRRLGWEFDGMRLHEYYFDNLGGDGKFDRSGNLASVLEAQFGYYESWELDFKAIGAMRGIGWVILYQDDQSGTMFNQWINEHDMGHAAGCRPVLVMDVFEHAFMLDYGLKKTAYIESFFKNIKWEAVEARLL